MKSKSKKVNSHHLCVQQWDLVVAISMSGGWGDGTSFVKVMVTIFLSGVGGAHKTQSPVCWYYAKAWWECLSAFPDLGSFTLNDVMLWFTGHFGSL